MREPTEKCAMVEDRKLYDTTMIVGGGRQMSMDGRKTGLNNNMLVLGASGAGKTRSVLMPNLLECDSNYIVFETKGVLYPALSPILRSKGYETFNIDFSSSRSSIGFDPLHFIRKNAISGNVDELDVFSLARLLCPIEDTKAPFWDLAAAGLLCSLISFVCEVPVSGERDPNFTDVLNLVEGLGTGRTLETLENASKVYPESYFSRTFNSYKGSLDADRMHASIIGILAEKMSGLNFRNARRLYEDRNQLNLDLFTRENPIAIFITLDDLDRAVAPLANCLVSQIIRGLIRTADAQPTGALPRPVRLFLDDAGNLKIPELYDILSIVRSREISVGVFTQSLSQLVSVYGFDDAMSIVSNCDIQILLGGALDSFTARQFSKRLNRSVSSLMESPRDEEWLMVRGQKPERLPIYDLTSHKNYRECPVPIKLEALEADLAPYMAKPSSVYSFPVIPDPYDPESDIPY